MGNDPKTHEINVNLPGYLEKYIQDITSPSVSGPYTEHITEHRHECEGVNWPAVLPSDIILAGRILVKSINQKRDSGAVYGLVGNFILTTTFVYY